MARPAIRPLGGSGISVSNLSLGSWRTFERIPRDAGIAVMKKARESGITFLDDARYNDETGSAPLKTGYSEVVFGELFRAAGWKRDEVVLANKVWWEFWPEQDAAAEVAGSLGRMGIDHLDLVYAERPPDGLALDEVVRQVGGIIKAGKVRAWGVLNWPAAQIAEVGRIATEQGVAKPCAAQLAYSVAMRSPVEDKEMVAALASCGASVVASFVMLGGVLSGKYLVEGALGRWSGELDDPRLRAGRDAAVELRDLAARAGTSPAALAIAFPLLNTHVASVLFGATSPGQVEANVKSLELLARLDSETREGLLRIGSLA
ncbi:MAG: aldo/keto reductase [Candidatus Dormibacteraeota bacterium]|nr:aldo/keto reductase [Candidatus Dormibacteraeota bacterium]